MHTGQFAHGRLNKCNLHCPAAQRYLRGIFGVICNPLNTFHSWSRHRGSCPFHLAPSFQFQQRVRWPWRDLPWHGPSQLASCTTWQWISLRRFEFFLEPFTYSQLHKGPLKCPGIQIVQLTLPHGTIHNNVILTAALLSNIKVTYILESASWCSWSTGSFAISSFLITKRFSRQGLSTWEMLAIAWISWSIASVDMV